MDNTKLTVMVVNKRVNTKVFMGDSLRYNNPIPGTIITDHIVD